MSPTSNQPDAESADRSKRVARRTVLAGCAVALAGCSSLPLSGGTTYERDDIDLSVSPDCAGDGTVRVTLAWEWNGDGGSSPDDVAAIYWDAEKWRLVESRNGTSETVEFRDRYQNGGIRGVTYSHDDAAADGGRSYEASCSLQPRGEFDEAARNVFGAFAHVREEPSGTEGDGKFGDVNPAWKESVETDQAALGECGDGES